MLLIKEALSETNFFLSGEECSSPLHDCGIDFEAAWSKRCEYKKLTYHFLHLEQEILNKCFLHKVLDLNWSVIRSCPDDSITFSEIFQWKKQKNIMQFCLVLPINTTTRMDQRKAVKWGRSVERRGGRWPKGSGNIARHLDVYRASHEGTTTSWGVKITICFYILLSFLEGPGDEFFGLGFCHR